MHAHENVVLALRLTHHERQVRQVVYIALVCPKTELPELGRQSGLDSELYLPLVAPAVLYDLGNRYHLNAVLFAEPLKVGDASHRAVLVHNLADHPGRFEARKTREVYRPLRLPSPLQNAARTSPQGEDMSRHHQVVRSCHLVHRNAAGMGPIGGRDAGRNAFLRLDGSCKRSTHARVVVLDHIRDLEPVDDFARHRQTDQAAPIKGHEIYIFRGYQLGGHCKVALVLPVLVIADDDHFSSFDLFYDLFYVAKRHLPRSSRKLVNSGPIAAPRAAPHTCLRCPPPDSPDPPARGSVGWWPLWSGAV